MDNKEERNALSAFVGQFVHKQRLGKVVDWLIDSQYVITVKDRQAIENAVLTYETVNRERVYWPENEYTVNDYIVKERFGFASSKAMEEVDPNLTEAIWEEVTSECEWRNGKLCMTEFDNKYPVARAANMIYKRIEPKLNDAQRAYKKQSYTTNYKLWDGAELSEAIIKYLKENRLQEYSQDQIATPLNAKSAYVYQLLQKIVADTKNGVITFKIASSSSKAQAAKRQVYKYAPERISLDQSIDRGAYMNRLVKGLLKKKSDISQRQVFLMPKKFLGQLDNKVVNHTLKKMVDAGELLCQRVEKDNACLYRLA